MHAWIGTDNGDQCYRCGAVLDYQYETDDSTEAARYNAAYESAAHSLIGPCPGPESSTRAHHYVLEGAADTFGFLLSCAYGDRVIRYDLSAGFEGNPYQCIGG